MKKLILLAIVLFAGYKFYKDGSPFSSTTAGAFDRDGKAKVVLFVGPGCNEHCETVRAGLRRRGIVFEEIDVADGSNKYRINRYPVTLIGKTEILGDDVQNIAAALAESFGPTVLTPMEQRSMAGHFDAHGKAKVVMYATSWCGYCRQQREFFAANNVSYEEVDVEASREGELTFQALKGNGYPLTYVGYRRFPGYQGNEILLARAELAKAGR